jgi:hypothetical protein
MSDSKSWQTTRDLTHKLARRTAGRTTRAIALAFLAAGGTFAACRAGGITSPTDEGGGISPKSSSGDLIGTGVVANVVPVKVEEDEAVAQANPDFSTTTETTFPVTEFITNTCHNDETPVLNGYLKQREKISMDDLTLKYKLQTWKDTRGTFATATTTWEEDDGYGHKTLRTGIVRYRNRTTTLDKFVTGPAGLPFASDQESVMYLERLSPEHGMHYGKYDDREDDDDDRDYRHGAGDDLFVFARQSLYVDKNGVTRQKTEFRTECR